MIAHWAQESNLAQFSEEAVHGYLFKTGLTDLVDETAALDEKPLGDEDDFQLWRIIKARALIKLKRLHNSFDTESFWAARLSCPPTTPAQWSSISWGTMRTGSSFSS
ncbi:hypothetical protein Msil_1285 [Methylocella silvestris BL2]|uniref:Uncharacterized protein n=1 Tax=Methylocella silvestris (strain DSM 15510 / CIP 108128 / LMG 27833 / NCIMB 13906 / BL2) TaxID=395965 RepID=B8ER69_METSB|nr:hypothetical protein [Methylocella silvestris]ACK50253.1 hypothetical protein Msil_1285 [Methylocella silvestris BL2]